MIKTGQRPHHTVFFKFLAVNIVILVMFYGITLYINSRIADSQERNIYRSSASKLELFLNKLDADILRQRQIQYQFADRYDLQKLSVAGHRLSEYEKVSIILRIQSDVLTYKMMCEYCENITISIQSVGRTISVKPILDYIETAVPVKPEDVDQPGIVFHNGFLFSTVYPPMSNNQAAVPLYSIRTDIAYRLIENDMRTYFSEYAEGAALMAADGTWQMSSTGTVPAVIQSYVAANSKDLMETDEKLHKLDIDGSRHWLVYRYSTAMDAFFVVYRPERFLTEALISTKYTIWILSAFTVLMILFSIFWIRRQFNDPMSQLMDALGKVEKGDLKMNIQYDRDDEFHYIYDKFNSMVTELNNQIELNYEHRIRTQQAELKQLQYHIKPHFLYNSIFLIYRMAGQGDQEAIQDFCLTLGNYYRYITRIENQTIPLERELGHIRDYIKIQSIRFGERIAVNMDPTPEGMQNQLVLPLMLQPIVENAYHHGLAMVESGGQIDIRMAVVDDIFTVTVDDNGKGLTLEELEILSATILENKAADTHTGLSNVHHRLRIQFGPESGLRLEHSPSGGLRVVLKLRFPPSQPA